MRSNFISLTVASVVVGLVGRGVAREIMSQAEFFSTADNIVKNIAPPFAMQRATCNPTTMDVVPEPAPGGGVACFVAAGGDADEVGFDDDGAGEARGHREGNGADALIRKYWSDTLSVATATWLGFRDKTLAKVAPLEFDSVLITAKEDLGCQVAMFQHEELFEDAVKYGPMNITLTDTTYTKLLHGFRVGINLNYKTTLSSIDGGGKVALSGDYSYNAGTSETLAEGQRFDVAGNEACTPIRIRLATVCSDVKLYFAFYRNHHLVLRTTTTPSAGAPKFILPAMDFNADYFFNILGCINPQLY